MTEEPLSTKERPLRRTPRALTPEQALEVIDATDHAVLSTCDPAGNPYGTAVSPVRITKGSVRSVPAASGNTERRANTEPSAKRVPVVRR